MSALSIGQIYDAAIGAGFSPTKAVIATAIALAESGGTPTSHCLNCLGVREDSRGLWQINVDAHPQYANANLYDPATNAAAAFAVSGRGSSFAPWSTYTNGAYSKFLGQIYGALGISAGMTPPSQAPNTTPVPSAPAAPSSPSGATVQNASLPGGALNPLNWFGDIASTVVQDVSKVVITALFVLGGVALVTVGLLRMVKPAVNKVANVAGRAAEAAG